MADGMVVLPPELREIAGQDGARINHLGAPLPSRRSDVPDFGDSAEIVISSGDGVTVAIGDGDLAAPYIRENPEPPPFGENLAQTLNEGTLAAIGSEIVQGVQADIASRSTWIEQYNKGIDLLGTKVEELANRGQRRNVSRAGHPLMIEAMVKYWAGAAGEMLPAAGPVKVPIIGRGSDSEQSLANAFQDDFNYYLTYVAKEYRPDTSQMLMQQAFCGIGYKKVYRDPIHRRPMSRSVLAPDLIVSEEASDLDTAHRVTHAIQMMKSQLRRMQIVGQYRNIDLGMPGTSMGLGQSANRKIKENEGISIIGFGRPEDQPYDIWESDSDLDIDHHLIDGFYERRTPEGLPLPYKIALEANSQKVLGIWRNWRPDDRLCMKRNMYVKFGLVPGMGYHDWGFLQLLGNQTRILRSIWRLLIDAGMFSNFPGGIKAKSARTSTNEIAPGPGEFVDIDIPSNMDITKLVMPMPYKDISSTFVQLAEIIKQDAMRLGGTVMLEVGEGRTNVPVGTVMSMIEQQVQVMAQVFKNNHAAQKEELHKLRELFAENPNDLWRLCRDAPRSADAAAHQWERQEEFMDLNLQPASDPNVPSSVHRMMSTNVLSMLAQQTPQYFDVREVIKDAVTAIGKDPDRFMARPEDQAAAPPPPDPKIVAATIKQQTDQAKQLGEAQMQEQRLDVEREHLAVEAAKAAADNQTDLAVAHARSHNTAGGFGGGGPQVVGFNGAPMPIP